MIIVISGTPGTGKTSVSNMIAELYNGKVLSLNEPEVFEEFNIHFDIKRDTYVVDTDKLLTHIITLIEEYKNDEPEYLIIEGHFSDIIPENYIDYAIILRCDPYMLRSRLENRGYKNDKILENVQAEILGNCANYFIQKNLKIPIYELNTSILTIESVVDIIITNIIKDENAENYLIGKIDWLEKLFQDNSLNDFFDDKIKP